MQSDINSNFIHILYDRNLYAIPSWYKFTFDSIAVIKESSTEALVKISYYIKGDVFFFPHMVEGLLFFPHAQSLFIVKEANAMNL